MNNILSKLKLNFQLLRHPVLINAFVRGQGEEIKHTTNWGDAINWFFLREIVKRPLALFDRISLAMRLNLKNYLVIGSTIDLLCRKNSEIWGAGIINESVLLKVKPKKVHAVRGPLTRKILIEQGVDCPEVYGDPAILVPLHYQPKVEKKYKYGFISHVYNLEDIENFQIDGKPLFECRDVLVIKLRNYKRWTDIPDQICSCENIISGSLHGLIMAEAYGIPNVWVEFGKPLLGGHFKFHDFFLSIGRDRDMPLHPTGKKFTTNEFDQELAKWKAGKIDLQLLLKSCPFPINLR